MTDSDSAQDLTKHAIIGPPIIICGELMTFSAVGKSQVHPSLDIPKYT